MYLFRISLTLLLLSPLVVNAGLKNLTEQDECILNAVKGSNGEVLVQTILDACNKKPTVETKILIQQEMEEEIAQQPPVAEKEPKTAIEKIVKVISVPIAKVTKTKEEPQVQQPMPSISAMPNDIVEQLNKTTGISLRDFNGNIFNVSKEWTITQITFSITPKNQENAVATEYDIKVEIPPQTSMDFFLSKEGIHGSKVNWKIVAAEGMPFVDTRSKGAKLMDTFFPDK